MESILRGEAARQSWEEPLEKLADGDPIPLAPGQQQIWLHSQMVPGSIYNEPITVNYRGALDRAVLERSLREVIRRHESWRTTFVSVDGQVLQAVHAGFAIAVPLTDLTRLPAGEREQTVLRLSGGDARRPFDLSVGPLLRARLFKYSDQDYRLHLVIHSIVMDARSISAVFLPELAAIYDAFAKGLSSPLPEPVCQYRDYARWQQRLLDNDAVERQLEYWRQRLSGELPSLQLPLDHTRPAAPSYLGGMERFAFSPAVTAALKEASEAHGVTPYVFLLATFKALLHRYSGQEDILVGGESDGRRRREFAGSLGYYHNTLVFRSRPQAAKPFREYLAEVRDAVLGAVVAGDVPMDRLVREFQQRRDLSRSPLFQAMLVLNAAPALDDARWDLTLEDVTTGMSRLDLNCAIDEREDGLAGRLTYNADVFEASTIQRMIGHWMNLVESALRDPELPLAELAVVGEEERERLCVEWNDTAHVVPHTTIHELFEAQAARTPNAIAVEHEGRFMSYRELNQEANRLARKLQELGAGPEVLVGLSVGRTCDMLISVLAVLKSGAAYLPLDPALPEERLNLLVEDSRIGILLTERGLEQRLARPHLRLVFCEEHSGSGTNLTPLSGPENLAYVLYTSGSTGRPKGVEIHHSAVVNFLLSMRREPGFTAGDTTLAITTLSFDIAALEIFLPLISGGRVVIASQEDPVHLLEFLDSARPTLMQGTPAVWRTLIEAGWKGNRKLKILCGGEAMARDLAQQLLARCGELWNMYGPTETTVWSTVHKVSSGSGPVPIGHPIGNTQVFVLDQRRQLVPQGVIGELYIAGAGVARRYLHRPDLTAERFIEQPELSSGRLYRTGDLARWLPGGILECLGRADHQIKIRGYRIEPEEIEAAILDHPSVTAAAVRAWTDASQHQSLTAYVVASVTPGAVRSFLEEKLPRYMIPTRWMAMDSLPLTPNGKVDRKRLPQPSAETAREEYVAPQDEIERRLVTLWESVLQRKGVGTRDNFFDLGGHSLLVAKLLRHLEFDFGARLSMAAIFQAPTIEQFAELLHSQHCGTPAPAAIPLQTRGSRPPLLWLYAGPIFRALAAHLGTERPFWGIAPDPEDVESLPQDFRLEDLAACLVRKIRRVQPEGPYNIGGWCADGILAYELASQLRRNGSHVDLLILLDSVNPTRYRGMRRREILSSRLVFNLKRLLSANSGGIPHFFKERLESVAYHFRESTRPSAAFESKLSHAADSYDPRPYGGRVAAIMPSQYPSYREPMLHWPGTVTGELQLKRVAGNHVTMLEEPWVSDLARCIAACLEEAEAEGERERESASAVKLAVG